MTTPFSAALLSARQKLGLSQTELARQLGINQSTVSMLEKGERRPGLETARRLSALLDVPVEDLLNAGDTDKRRPALVKLIQIAGQLDDSNLEVLNAMAATLVRTKRIPAKVRKGS